MKQPTIQPAIGVPLAMESQSEGRVFGSPGAGERPYSSLKLWELMTPDHQLLS